MAQSTFVLPSEWVFPQFGGTNAFDDYEPVAVVGQGTFGITFSANRKETDYKYAIKVISKRKLGTQQEVQDVQREVQILQQLQGHPNIVDLIKVYEDKQNICIVTEFCAGGDLFDRMNKHLIKQHAALSEREAAGIMRTIVSVIAHCHERGVMHRDVKLENFVFTDDTEGALLKAVDFGLSTNIQRTLCQDIVGSAFYMAPEVLMKAYGKECDMWSAGVVLYVLLAGYQPFNGDNENKIFEAVRTKQLDLTSQPWPSISDSAKDLVQGMLNRYTNKRLTAQQVLQHPWMTQS